MAATLRAMFDGLRAFLSTYIAHYRALRRNARLFLISNSILNIGTFALFVTYAIFLQDLGFDTDYQSTLLIVGIVGAVAGLPPAIIVAQRYSTRRLLVWSNLIGGTAFAAQLVFPVGWVLLVTSFVIGMSASIYVILTPALLAANSTNAERGHLFSLNATLGLLTAMLGTLLGGFLPTLFAQPIVQRFPLIALGRPLLVHGSALPLQLSLLFAGALTIPCLWPLILMDDSTTDDRIEARVVTAPQRDRWREGQRWLAANLRRSTIQRVLHWPATRYAAYLGLIGFGAGLFTTYLNIYFVRDLHVSTGLFGTISSAGTLLLALATLGGPILAARVGTVRGVVVVQLCSLPLLVALGLATNVSLIVAIYLTRIIMMDMGQPVLQGFVIGILPRQERITASSVINITTQVMMGAGGVISGYANKAHGYGVLFLAAAVCYLAAMLLLVPWFGKEQSLSQTEDSAPSIVQPQSAAISSAE